jgi:hypothetical protein
MAATGSATVSYTANGCVGADVITATTTALNKVLTASATITVQAAAVGAIQFISATPTNIALKGTGGAGRPESSTVVFQVKDAASAPRAGADVQFSLNTSVGGITLNPTSGLATTDANGNAQIVVNAGTVATSVRITATVVGTTPGISTQSSQLTITTGIPAAATFSLAVQCQNVYGWDVDGTIVPVTARLADRFNNPVPDGTAVTFTTEGGSIAAQCTTTTTPSESGVCTVNWRSSNPRPANGRSTIFAKAIGEESFTDSNGNGSFDPGESFVDLSEPFRDDNENGVYDSSIGEDFFDFNNDQVRNGPDGLFNGVLCNDPARCGGANTRSTGIGVSNLIIMSGKDPTVNQITPAGAINVAPGGSVPVSFWVRDVNGNPLPNGTSITLSASGAGLGIAAPASLSVPCTILSPNVQSSGITLFGYSVTGGPNAGTSGTITLTITVPGQQAVVYGPIPVSVN